MSTTRKSYKSDVSDAEWEFLLPYLTLMREDAPQRDYSLRDVFDAMRYVVKTGCQWDFLPHDFPPWTAVYQQARRWIAAGVFEEITHDLRSIRVRRARRLRNKPRPTASAWRWPSIPRPRRDSSCCRDAGWSNGVSAGSAGSAAWPQIRSG